MILTVKPLKEIIKTAKDNTPVLVFYDGQLLAVDDVYYGPFGPKEEMQLHLRVKRPHSERVSDEKRR